MANNLKLDPFDVVLFGATGDLAKRKLVRALYRRAAAGRFPTGSKIIGVRARRAQRASNTSRKRGRASRNT